MEQENLFNAIIEKYKNLGENPATYLKGLLHSKPLNYWEYIEVDTLLSLQKTRTGFKDETSFILYNQITELVLKLILHEIEQLTGENNPTEEVIIEKLNRVNRYTEMLIVFFNIMKSGIDYDDYNNFRFALAPASGFQSAQFRYIELHCTSLENLINENGKKGLSVNPEIEECFEHIYWKDAGLNRATGEKTYTLKQFEEKYLSSFIELAKKLKGNTLEDKVCRFQNPSPLLQEKLREFDRLYNIEWPMAHLSMANHYLDKRGENTASTGNSDWKKYLHPESQQRKFFPSLWTNIEKINWGHTNHKKTTV